MFSSLLRRNISKSLSKTLSVPKFTLPSASFKRFMTYDKNKTSVSDFRGDRVYHWISEEAEDIISRSYANHEVPSPLPAYRGPASTAELESLGNNIQYKPITLSDHLALNIMRFLRIFTHLFFRNKHASHAVVLETVAAIPGYVGSAHIHLKSLRSGLDDYDWIRKLNEESENERMHLLIWLTYVQPTLVERGLIAVVQIGYLTIYSSLYFFFPNFCHRMTGYLEYEAVEAYTAFLNAIDSGELPNTPAPPIASRYYGLDADATIRDVVLRVRADECMHRDFNHHLAEKYRFGDKTEPTLPGGLEANKKFSNLTHVKEDVRVKKD